MTEYLHWEELQIYKCFWQLRIHFNPLKYQTIIFFMVYSYGLDAVKDIAVNGDMHLTKNSLEKVWHAVNMWQ